METSGSARFAYAAWRVSNRESNQRITRAPLGELPPATHGEELAYVFGNLSASRINDRSGTDASDRSLSAQIMDAWVRFAARGDPNGGNLPHWSRYDAASDQYLQFGDSIVAKTVSERVPRLCTGLL